MFTNQEEIWKDIEGYEGLYQISSMGRVKSLERKNKGRWGCLKTVPEKILRPRNDGRSYYFQVNLSKDNKAKNYLVHRLVAQAFLPNPHNLPEINHINERKIDNRASNLEWCDRQYNVNYSKRKISKKVLQYTVEGKFIREWPSTTEVGRNGFSQSEISMCCNGKLKTHKGYIWKYKEVG